MEKALGERLNPSDVKTLSDLRSFWENPGLDTDDLSILKRLHLAIFSISIDNGQPIQIAPRSILPFAKIIIKSGILNDQGCLKSNKQAGGYRLFLVNSLFELAYILSVYLFIAERYKTLTIGNETPNIMMRVNHPDTGQELIRSLVDDPTDMILSCFVRYIEDDSGSWGLTTVISQTTSKLLSHVGIKKSVGTIRKRLNDRRFDMQEAEHYKKILEERINRPA